MLVVRSPQTKLLKVEDNLALFYQFGNPFYLKGPQVRSLLFPLWQEIEHPQKIADLKVKFNEHEVDKLLAHLEKMKLVVVSSAASNVDNSDRDISGTRGANVDYLRLIDPLFLFEKKTANEFNAIHFISFAVNPMAYMSSLPRIGDIKISYSSYMPGERVHGSKTVPSERRESIFARQDGLPWIRELEEHPFEYVEKVDVFDKRALYVLLGSWANLSEMLDLNQSLINCQWISVLEDSYGVTLGPWHASPESACLRCLALHRESQMLSSNLDRFISDKQEVSSTCSPAMQKIAAEVLAIEISKGISRTVFSKLKRGVYEFDFINHRSKYSELISIPTCLDCGELIKTSPFSWTSYV